MQNKEKLAIDSRSYYIVAFLFGSVMGLMIPLFALTYTNNTPAEHSRFEFFQKDLTLKQAQNYRYEHDDTKLKNTARVLQQALGLVD